MQPTAVGQLGRLPQNFSTTTNKTPTQTQHLALRQHCNMLLLTHKARSGAPKIKSNGLHTLMCCSDTQQRSLLPIQGRGCTAAALNKVLGGTCT